MRLAVERLRSVHFPWCLARATTCTVLAAFAWGTLPSEQAVAQDLEAADRAFQTARRAELAEDFPRAAEFYELADSIVPAPEALRSALRMRRRARQPELAAAHAEVLLRLYPNDRASRAIAESTLAAVAGQLVKVRVSCVLCTVLIDERVASSRAFGDHIIYVQPGTYEIGATFADGVAPGQSITVALGDAPELTFRSPAPEIAAPARPVLTGNPPSSGLSPWFFGTGAVVTAGFVAGAVLSGLAARGAADDFETGGYRRTDFETANGLETQTNVLIAGAVGGGIVTVVFAAFTDWGDDDGEQDSSLAVLPVVQPAGGTIVLRGQL